MALTESRGAEPESVPRAVVAGVFLVALGTLFYEVLLTRIFSVTLWYHFGFLAISLALLGTAASAVLCFLYPERLAGEHHLRNMALAAAAFGIAAPAAVVHHVTATLPGFDSLGLFYLAFGFQLTLLFVSFFAAGLCISIALFKYSSRIGTVYAFDLVGASLGSVLVVPFMYAWSPMALVFVVAAISLVVAVGLVRAISGSLAAQGVLSLLALAALTIGVLNDDLRLIRIGSVKSYGINETQKATPENVYERWSPVSRVSVEKTQPDWANKPILLATNDAGAPTVLTPFDGNFKGHLALLEKDSTLCAFQFKTNAKVLIIGVGGGRDVLVALATGQREITAVEINPLMGDVVSRAFADYIGNIFDDPRVTLHIQEGRNFVAASDEKYDLIELSMIDSWSSAAAAGAYVFNENTLYTIDAIEDFVEHLEPDGILSMTRYYAWDEALRVVTMMASYLESQGIRDVHRRIMVIGNGMSRPAVTVLLKNGIFTKEEAQKLAAVAANGNSTVIWAPHLGSHQLASVEARRPFEVVLKPGDVGTTRQRFIDERARDISPPTDDRPFFFYTQRTADLFRSRPAQAGAPVVAEHAARRLALPMLYAMALAMAVIALITIFVPLYLRSGTEIKETPNRMRSLGYFAMLGTGFMLIEISLIQRLTVFLGHPTWSFVVVLATVLFCSGAGSQYSSRWSAPEPRILQRILLGITGLVLVYAFVVYDQLIDLMWLGKTARIATSVIMIAPAAFLMGMCFPMGIQIVRRFHETLVPWGWGVNGAFSVFASVFSIVLALAVGFKAGMLLGVCCYAFAWLLIRSLPVESAPASG